MGASVFQAGERIEIEGKTYVLLRKVETDTWQVEDNRTKRVIEYSLYDLQCLYTEGKLTFASNDVCLRTAPKSEKLIESYPLEAWKMAKVRRSYVVAIMDLPSNREYLPLLIQRVWEKEQNPIKAPHVSTVIRWKQKYLSSGKDISSLIERTSKKGNRHERFSKSLEEIVKRAIDDVYLCRERGTITDTLHRAIALVQRENNLRTDADQLSLPTRRLITRLINVVPAFDRHAARYGRMAAIKRYRSVQAHRQTDGPLARAEMDHTLLDLMVIDDQTALPLGRPWITVCIDDFTRNILGIHIGFEPPSYFTVARCLKHAFLPKVRLQNDYPDIGNRWDAHGTMRELVVDNGMEFHSESLENACYTLGIEIHYSARKTPWFKGKIERFLGTLNRAVAHGNPGTTFGNIFEKDEYEPSKHAVVRYSTLKEVINKWIADVYHQKPHRALGMSPATMWANSITPEEIQVPDDPARLDAILGRSAKRCLTHKGIELFGLLYNSPELTRLRHRHGEKLDLEIRIDSSDLGQITVFSPDMTQMFKVPAIDFKYASGVSEWQHKICKRYAAQRLKSNSSSGWIEAKLQIAELVENELSNKKQKTRKRAARYVGDVKPINFSSMHSSEPTIIAQGLSTTYQKQQDLEQVDEDAMNSFKPHAAAAQTVMPRKRFAPVIRERMNKFLQEEQNGNVQEN